MSKNFEVLAPVSSWEALKAAAGAGAEAIYFGSTAFNARRNAANFDENEIKPVISYCHQRGIKAYFTLNTVIFDSEIDKALKLAEFICEVGIDAIILQDAGLARLIHMAAPKVKLHASTQMSVHNIAGVKELASMGFSRVVLARELTAEELTLIAASSPIELEIFVHGAHCMSMSGQCYMSAFFGGSRSGNRGLCAQPCRLPFMAGNSNYVLSLKDLSLITHIRDLSKKGVFSLKIEGRMKRPEYVAAATALCSKAASGDEVSLEELDDLKSVFSRDGFTQGYYDGNIGREMFGTRSREDVAAAAGTLKKLRRLYEGVERQRIRVNFSLAVNSSKVTLKAQDEDGNEAFAEGIKPEIAVNRAIDSITAGEKLSKTGSTPFYAGKIETEIEPGLTVPVSEINLLRRQVLENLLEIRGKARVIAFKRPDDIKFSTEKKNNVEKFRMRFQSLSQIPQNIDAYQVDMIFIPVSEFAGDLKINLQKGLKVGVELPRAFFGDERKLFEALQNAAAQGIKDALCGNIGAINIARRAGFTIHGDFGLNITNSAAVDSFVLQGAKSCVISFETPISAVREIVSNSAEPCGIIVYGRLPLMLVRNCPVRSFSGCKGGGCKISDRTGCDFPVQCCNTGFDKAGINKASEILNSRPLWLADVSKEIKKANLNFAQFYFTIETQSEVEKILTAWNSGEKYEGDFTRGLYFHSLT